MLCKMEMQNRMEWLFFFKPIFNGLQSKVFFMFKFMFILINFIVLWACVWWTAGLLCLGVTMSNFGNCIKVATLASFWRPTQAAFMAAAIPLRDEGDLPASNIFHRNWRMSWSMEERGSFCLELHYDRNTPQLKEYAALADGAWDPSSVLTTDWGIPHG